MVAFKSRQTTEARPLLGGLESNPESLRQSQGRHSDPWLVATECLVKGSSDLDFEGLTTAVRVAYLCDAHKTTLSENLKGIKPARNGHKLGEMYA